MAITVKREGHAEHFDERKVYASVYSAALSSHLDEKTAEVIAEDVCKEIKSHMHNKECIESHKLKNEVIKALKDYKDVQLMYKHHMDLS